MADKNDKDKKDTKGADEKTAPAKGAETPKFVRELLDEGVKEIARDSADPAFRAVQNRWPEFIAWIQRNPNKAKVLRSLRLAVRGDSIWAKLANEAVSDFINEFLQKATRGGPGGSATPSQVSKAAPAIGTQFWRLLDAIGTLSIPEMDDFYIVFFKPLRDAGQELFLQGIASLNDEQLNRMVKNVPLLQRFQADLQKKATPAPPRITYPEFRKQVQQDAKVLILIRNFLIAINAHNIDGQKKFWAIMQKMVENGQLTKLDDLRNILLLPTSDEIKRSLGWDRKDPAERLTKVFNTVKTRLNDPQATGFGSQQHADGLLARMQQKLKDVKSRS